jgi:hypothetical protein
MATMTHRASFALDSRAISRLKKLSTIWQTSQAEVIRRSLEIAEQSSSGGNEIENRLKAFEQLRTRLKKRKINVEAWIQTSRESRR